MAGKRGIDWVVVLLGITGLSLAFAWIWFAKRLSDDGQTIGLVALLAFFVLIAIVENVRRDRRLDEMELAASRFGARWALVASSILLCIPFMPAVQSLIVALEMELTGSGNEQLPTAVKIFVIGMVCSIVVQQLTAKALSAIWTLAKR
jgi:hypothetical protein